MNDDKPQIFPPAFVRFEKPLRDLQVSTEQIDKHIAELLKAQPKPVAPIPGSSSPTPGNSWLEIKKLELQKQHMTEEYYKGLSIELVNVDARLEAEIRSIVKDQLTPDIIKGKSQEGPLKKEKDPSDKNFNFMDSLKPTNSTNTSVIISHPAPDPGKEQLRINGRDITDARHSKDYLASLNHRQLSLPEIQAQKELADEKEFINTYEALADLCPTGQGTLPGDNLGDKTPDVDEPEI